MLSVYENSEHLPSLPVPCLSDTLERLKETIWPIAMNSVEFANTLHLIERFSKSAGPKLNLLLRNKANQTKNWLTHDWWVREAYLRSRSPLVINSNPAMIYPVLPFEVNNQRVFINTVAQLISGIIDFKLALIHGYNPEATNSDNECHLDPYLCYDQYRNLFGSIRVPGERCDSVMHAKQPQHSLNAVTSDNLQGNGEEQAFNLVISYRGKFFEIQLNDIENEQGRIDTLTNILDKLIDSVQASGHSDIATDSGAGVLTASKRDDWARAYKLLDDDSMNAIRDAQFVVCIDTVPNEPGDTFSSSLLNSSLSSEQHLEALARQVLHGDRQNVGNRWFDKSIQLIVVTNDSAERLLGAGINYEHSFAEGTVVTKLIEYSYDKTVQKQREQNSAKDNLFAKQQIVHSGQQGDSAAVFRQLKMFNEDNMATIEEYLKQAKQEFISQVDQFGLSYFAYKQYGSNAIKLWHFSPDSWFQVALQWAYYKLHKRPGPCYESASTRRFAYGRTETIRSLTKDVAQFCFEPKFDTMQAAIASHKSYALAANNASAIDRVLLGYRLIFDELKSNKWSWGIPAVDGNANMIHEWPSKEVSSSGDSSKQQQIDINDIFTEKELDIIGAFFNNELIARSKQFALSTSQVSSTHPNIFMSYGPLLADGYACCYNITGQQIVAAITANSSNQSFSCEVNELNKSLRNSLDQMREIVEEQRNGSKS